MKRWSYILAALLLVSGFLAGCTSPQQTSEPQQPPGQEAPKVAWQPVLDSGSADLFYAAPDGSGYLFKGGDGLLYVAASDHRVQAIAPTLRSYRVGGVTVQAHLAETPYGRMLVEERPSRQFSLSPDGRKLAIAENGLWVADVERGTVTQVGSEPQPAPVPLRKHQRWEWATFPSWSADGQWIYFYATREQPSQEARWRVPSAGGNEELVSRQDTGPYGTATLPDGRVVHVEYDAIDVYPAAGGEPIRLGSGLTGPYTLSPDGRWALVLDRTNPALYAIDVAAGDTRMIPLPAGSGPELTPLWNGDRALFRTRPAVYNGPAFLTVLDMPSGQLTHFASPDPARADVWPLGWDASGRILARILPPPDFMYPEPEKARSDLRGVWLLDPEAYQPPKPTTPRSLRYAGLAGPGPMWSQYGVNGVKGGETSTVPGAFLLLRFDEPLDEAWIRKAVMVEGPAAVEVHGAPLGLAFVRLDGAAVGDTVRVRIPALQFDLQLQVSPPSNPEQG